MKITPGEKRAQEIFSKLKTYFTWSSFLPVKHRASLLAIVDCVLRL